MGDKNDRKKIVNSSGFPLQIKLKHLVDENSQNIDWHVLSEEHAWNYENDSKTGFIDLILESIEKEWLLLVECKRVRETEWIFLRDKNTSKNRRQVKAWITAYRSGRKLSHEWLDTAGDPKTPQSMFCIVAGQDPKSKPMLERIASELVLSVESFAEKDRRYCNVTPDYLRMSVPVIVTTAELKLCTYDPKDISIKDGELSEADFETVPFIRFRKQLSNREYSGEISAPLDYRQISAQMENTVFIVNSEHFLDFLTQFNLDEKPL